MQEEGVITCWYYPTLPSTDPTRVITPPCLQHQSLDHCPAFPLPAFKPGNHNLPFPSIIDLSLAFKGSETPANINLALESKVLISKEGGVNWQCNKVIVISYQVIDYAVDQQMRRRANATATIVRTRVPWCPGPCVHVCISGKRDGVSVHWLK
jgi:hypothetical protein